jgi:hypothetical protein
MVLTLILALANAIAQTLRSNWNARHGVRDDAINLGWYPNVQRLYLSGDVSPCGTAGG